VSRTVLTLATSATPFAEALPSETTDFGVPQRTQSDLEIAVSHIDRNDRPDHNVDSTSTWSGRRSYAWDVAVGLRIKHALRPDECRREVIQETLVTNRECPALAASAVLDTQRP
jgi:hypothetical protein